MYTLGHKFIPPPIHAGGLRYHGDAPLLCKLTNEGHMKAQAYHQNEVFEAATTFARTEGILVAPETAHCVKATIDEAVKCKETGKEETIFFANSGHGHFDLAAYEAYYSGKLTDYEYPEEKIKMALQDIPKI
jgi:tryptophan synthase beta chain